MSAPARFSKVFGPRARALAAAVAALGVLAMGLGACAKRITEVDATYVLPEGRVSPDAQMVLWYEEPVEVRAYLDASEPPGPDSDPHCPATVFADVGDPLVDVQTFDFKPAGSINATLLDHTAATSFRPMRKEANGGYRSMLDFPIKPSRKWLENQWELYTFNDSRPSGFQPPTYIARGLVNGAESAQSPLTNEAVAQRPAPLDLTYTGLCLPCDSLFTLRWNPVPGAARYWLHVYQLASGVTDTETLQATRPSPLDDTRPRDILLAFMDGSATSYKLRDATRHDIVRLVERATNYNQTYRVRIAAIDSTGQLLAINRGNFGLFQFPEGYALVRLNANLVSTKRPGNSFPFCQNETP